MLKCLLNLVAGCTLLVAPVAYPADQAAAAPPVEYELVNDFAARLQTHLQQTGKILGQLRQTSDPGERQKLMNAYLAAVRTTAHITHTMQQLLDGGKGMAGEPKMGGMMKGGKCSCGMMRERASGKTSEAAPNPPAARDDSANRPAPDVEGEGDSDEHEGHHQRSWNNFYDCTSKPVGGVEYYSCGDNFYPALFQGTQLVYVTAKP